MLQGLQGEGDCVCLDNLVPVTSLILRLSCNEGGGKSQNVPPLPHTLFVGRACMEMRLTGNHNLVTQ